MSNGLAIASSHHRPFTRINCQKGDGHITMQKGTQKKALNMSCHPQDMPLGHKGMLELLIPD